MPSREWIVDPATLDLNHIVADLDTIRQYNPQRFEMEQLTAVVFEDTETHRCAGYKDLEPDEFWIRGHMPGMPLMPGVIICEAAAQLCSYYAVRHRILDSDLIGLGGLDAVRFRDPVRPGDRLVVSTGMTRLRRGALVVCRFEAFVEGSLVAEGQIKGVPLNRVQPSAPTSSAQMP